jgi:hypothetical protein
MHVVVDGDSLAKLAGRYLDDPRRSQEIFELNRAVLSDPELLPIGVELQIPAMRYDGPSGHSASLRKTTVEGSSLHAATNTGLVQVRPVPEGSGIVPRAQLLRPQPAE